MHTLDVLLQELWATVVYYYLCGFSKCFSFLICVMFILVYRECPWKSQLKLWFIELVLSAVCQFRDLFIDVDCRVFSKRTSFSVLTHTHTHTHTHKKKINVLIIVTSSMASYLFVRGKSGENCKANETFQNWFCSTVRWYNKTINWIILLESALLILYWH